MTARTRLPRHRAAEAPSLLERARACYERHEWNDAFEALSLADEAAPLAADDLNRLVWSAGLTARDDEMLVAQERLYQARLDAGERLPAARAALWLGFRLFARGEPARAGGWLGRSQHLVEDEGRECVEQGYLLLPAVQRFLNLGQLHEARDAAARAVSIGERFADVDLVAFARNLQGRALLAQGQLSRGLDLIDEAMFAVVSGELSPLVTGLIYCSAIATCQRVYAFERTREWTTALTGWCEAHPQLVMFKGHCLVHRAEILQMRGFWPEALDEARRAVERAVGQFDGEAAGRAHYLQAEIHRLRGEAAEAEAAYRIASRCGVEPQPGLALLRLEQGDLEVAANAIRRVLAATNDRLRRVQLLPAHIEIMLAVGDLEEARAASRELEHTAAIFNTDALCAITWNAFGSIQLAEGNARLVLDPVRRAFGLWRQMAAPYLAAGSRVLLAKACDALGDVEGAKLELHGAQEVFEGLNALPALAKVKAIAAILERHRAGSTGSHGLTERELEVLRLVARGMTNKAIARELVLSGKTVDRHVSNIYTKLDLSSRSAATAFAYEHRLI